MWVSSIKVIQIDYCMQNWIKVFKDILVIIEGIV